MKKTLLSFENVRFGYRLNGRVIMSDVSVGIKQGSVTAILGPNGAGKTTLLKLALGRLKPHSGQVLIEDQPLESYSRRELGRWMGLVPQGEHLPYDYSLLEYVVLGRAPYLKPLEMPGDIDCQIAKGALEQVGLIKYQDRPVTRLSGGEQQMVLVARALAQQPRLLFLDEPTAHLDLKNKYRLIDLLRKLVLEGVTIVFTTHEPEIASILATDLVLIRDGQIIHTGSLEDTLTGERLSDAYQMPVKVVPVDGRKIVIWS